MHGTDLMPFGKYSKPPDGPRKMDDVPADYLLWLWDENVSHHDVRAYIVENFETLLAQCPDYIPEELKDEPNPP